MSRIALIFICIVFLIPVKAQKLAIPSDIQFAWQEMELTMFVHFGPATWQGREYDDLSTPLSRINPQKLDTDQWVDVALSYGAKMIIMVAKHTGGFCWWNTKTSDYSIANTPWKNGQGDVLADLAASCKKKGVKLGVYLSPEDHYLEIGIGGRAKDPTFQETYQQVYRQQLIELLTSFGDIHEIWVDGSLIFDISDIIKQYAPRAVIFQSSAATIRWVGNEMGFAPYPAWNTISAADAQSGNSTASHGNPNADTWVPIEVDVSILRPNWFWAPKNEKNLLSLDELMKIYYCSVGRGCNFLVNVCPDTTGAIPAPQAKRLAEFGNEIKKRFDHPVAQIHGNKNELMVNLKKGQVIDHVILQEDLTQGERVRKFVIEAKSETSWKEIFSGSAIGHKLIVQVSPPQQSQQIRLRILESAGLPHIRQFAVFHTKTKPIEMPVVADNWNIRNVGVWELDLNRDSITVNLDLTQYCQSAQTYEVAFVLKGEGIKDPGLSYDWSSTGTWVDNLSEEQRLHLFNRHLLFAGVNADQYFVTNNKYLDRLAFNLTGIPAKLEATVTIAIPKGLKHAKIEAFLLKK